MVSIHTVQSGVIKYIDDEILPKLQGWKKWTFGAISGLAVTNLPNTFQKIKGNAFVESLGVVDHEGRIDLNKLYSAFIKQAEKGAVVIDIPVLGGLTVDKTDIDKLYKFIMEASNESNSRTI
ncbi:MAG: hypothetical protein J6S14_12720 [Clostridia bacterium]|nr:hypothetical protein [Clostridia bacterium]